MQDHFANRDKTGTVSLLGREVLMLGWLVCLGERKSPVDHVLTHEQKKWDGNSGTKHICG